MHKPNATILSGKARVPRPAEVTWASSPKLPSNPDSYAAITGGFFGRTPVGAWKNYFFRAIWLDSAGKEQRGFFDRFTGKCLHSLKNPAELLIESIRFDG